MLNLFQHPFLRMHNDREAAVRLHPGQPGIWDALHWRHIWSDRAALPAPHGPGEGFYDQISGLSLGTFRTVRNNARRNLTWETAQALAQAMEDQPDRERESAMDRFGARPWAATAPSCWT